MTTKAEDGRPPSDQPTKWRLAPPGYYWIRHGCGMVLRSYLPRPEGRCSNNDSCQSCKQRYRDDQRHNKLPCELSEKELNEYCDHLGDRSPSGKSRGDDDQ